jgi:hypothetical protein
MATISSVEAEQQKQWVNKPKNRFSWLPPYGIGQTLHKQQK